MRIRKLGGVVNRWRWESNGLFGYATTKRGAAAAARAASTADRPAVVVEQESP